MSTRSERLHRAKSDRTRARILDAARTLFNEHGTAAVSTNRIAAAAGLSPGNLYYHYADKQEIIRALHTQYASAHEDWWEPSGRIADDLATLRRNLVAGMALAWEYRFFEREARALLRADGELRDTYLRAYGHRLDQWVSFGEQLVEQGALRRPRSPSTVRDVATAIWLIAENWIPFLDVTGDPTDEKQVAAGTELILTALDPYLTAKGRRALR